VLNWNEGLFWRRLVTWPALVFVLAIGLFGAALPFYCYIMDDEWVGVILPFAALCIAGGVSTHILVRRSRVMGAIGVMVALGCCLVAYTAGPLVARVNDANSARSFCHSITEWIEGDETLLAYNFYRPVYAYYTGKQVVNIVDIDDLLKRFQQKEVLNVVMRERDFLAVRERATVPLHILLKQRIDHRYVVLVSNDGEDRVAGVTRRAGGKASR
jgi:hypothetical protein